MPFGFGKKEEPAFTTDSTEKEDLEEIQRIAHRLEKDESVVVMAKQSRFKPGGSKLTPDTIFITNKRIIIRNPSALGMRENIESITYDKITAMELERGMFSSTLKIRASGYQGDIDAIPKEKAEKMAQYVKEAMERIKKVSLSSEHSSSGQLSVADELAKLAKLKEQGVLSDSEFQQMKQDLMKRL